MNPLAEAVAATADAARSANHATVRAPITATEAYDVVGHLDDVARRLPQLVEFLTRSITRADAADYFDDRGGDTKLTLTVALTGLFEARHDLDQAAHHLDQTHNALGHLGRRTPED